MGGKGDYLPCRWSNCDTAGSVTHLRAHSGVFVTVGNRSNIYQTISMAVFPLRHPTVLSLVLSEWQSLRNGILGHVRKRFQCKGGDWSSNFGNGEDKEMCGPSFSRKITQL